MVGVSPLFFRRPDLSVLAEVKWATGGQTGGCCECGRPVSGISEGSPHCTGKKGLVWVGPPFNTKTKKLTNGQFKKGNRPKKNRGSGSRWKCYHLRHCGFSTRYLSIFSESKRTARSSQGFRWLRATLVWLAANGGLAFYGGTRTAN